MPSRQHRRHSLPAGALAALLLAPAAGPAVAFAGYEAHYEVATSGLAIGRADLRLEPSEDGAALGFSFATQSLLGLIDPSLTRLRTSLRRDGRSYMPDFFTSLFEKEDRSREIDATFAADGSMATYELKKRGRVRVDRVPEDMTAAVVDPLTALVRARAWLDGAVEGAALPLEIFDGRKRYRVALRYLGPVQTAVTGESVAAHQVAARYRITAELDEDEGRWLEAEEPAERDLDMLISADGRYLPLRLSGSFAGMPLTAVLADDCPAPPGCVAN